MIWCIEKARAEIEKCLPSYLVQMKTEKFAFEINWQLSTVRGKFESRKICKGLAYYLFTNLRRAYFIRYEKFGKGIKDLLIYHPYHATILQLSWQILTNSNQETFFWWGVYFHSSKENMMIDFSMVVPRWYRLCTHFQITT